ncbi:uncharacterized protein LOC18425624 isoform X2 [Amborella trichopoda]|uniref:DNA polymerase delta subunit 3 n=1 Tax=Amborella trichopoda TaxID=13333 RepID=W1NPD7_AMBTC|nr:uncharacterized protein LOC18425624 isoform X2 [Amborella trichopoda]ERM97647.1 hypothetical protein AMTR_s00130p00054840 [Amborella trichopoda]|eukprot:XP_006830231.1 uncharacterized protein LOC18425624 isoform X2 [Amborella trichopoda]
MGHGGFNSSEILNEIQTLISDRLQVVSYKWLSRNFSVSSNIAKRLLQEFVDCHGDGLEVIYALSGWSTSKHPYYSIRLVSRFNLDEVQREFKDGCSVQVYSVQPCIPKDPTELWNAEFVQAEELFNQPSTVENCLRDNRFSAVSNSFVKRNTSGAPLRVGHPEPKKGSDVAVPSRNNGIVLKRQMDPQAQKEKAPQTSTEEGLQEKAAVIVIKNQGAQQIHNQGGRPQVDTIHVGKKKTTNDKSSSAGSLASLWDRASAKSKPSSDQIDSVESVPKTILSAEGHIRAREAVEEMSSGDEEEGFSRRRISNNGGNGRKRRVVFCPSDDDDDDDEIVVSIATPEPPKSRSVFGAEAGINNSGSALEKMDMHTKEQNSDGHLKEKQQHRDNGVRTTEKIEDASKGVVSKVPSSEVIRGHINGEQNNEDKNAAIAPAGPPKRRKVLKTRIDERGREVTEVVWEGDADDSSNTAKEAITNNTDNRSTAAPKAPAPVKAAPFNPPAKGGVKKPAKGGVKDPKQGNILSFFKKA